MRRLLVFFVIGAGLVSPLSAASIDGVKIHVSSAGSGKATVVFVHGWTCDSTSWAAQVRPSPTSTAS